MSTMAMAYCWSSESRDSLKARRPRLKKTADEHGDGGCKTQQNPERDCGRAGMRWIGGTIFETIFRTAQHGEDNRFQEEQSEAGRDSGDGQATFAHCGEHYEVQRDQQGGEDYGGAPGTGVNLPVGEEID